MKICMYGGLNGSLVNVVVVFLKKVKKNIGRGKETRREANGTER